MKLRKILHEKISREEYAELVNSCFIWRYDPRFTDKFSYMYEIATDLESLITEAHICALEGDYTNALLLASEILKQIMQKIGEFHDEGQVELVEVFDDCLEAMDSWLVLCRDADTPALKVSDEFRLKILHIMIDTFIIDRGAMSDRVRESIKHRCTIEEKCEIKKWCKEAIMTSSFRGLRQLMSDLEKSPYTPPLHHVGV